MNIYATKSKEGAMHMNRLYFSQHTYYLSIIPNNTKTLEQYSIKHVNNSHKSGKQNVTTEQN